MLSHITGSIESLGCGYVTVALAGIGWQVQVSTPEIFAVHEKVTLYTYLHWNAEQGPSLFGFKTENEKKIFLLLISCSGIGPKMALAVLAHLSPALFIKAIQENDEKALSAVSGIGAKKAEQIIVQLRHKVEKLLDTGIDLPESDTLSMEQWKNITQVLQSLNYSKAEVDLALNHVRKEQQGVASFDLLMRQALSFLAKRV